MVGADIYGNGIRVPAGVSPGTASIAPGESQEFEGTLTIPNDGTLHNPNGNSITAEISFQFTPQGETEPVEPDPITTGSSANVNISVVPNLQVDFVDVLPGTYRGGDIARFTIAVSNDEPLGQTLETRPLTTSDDHRTEMYLTDDTSLDRSNDFRLAFFSAAGSLLGLGPELNDLPDGRSTIRRVEVLQGAGTPEVIDTFGRDYSPQPVDTFLDRDETLLVTVEVLMPRNFEGEFFIGGFADVFNDIAETEEGVNATFGDQGDNVLVDQLSTTVRLISADDPTVEPVSERTAQDGSQIEQSDGRSDNPSVSENGEWVVFDSIASNLDPDLPGNGNRQVYLRNTESRDIEMISVSNSGAPGNRDSLNPVISADGRFVAYESRATNFDNPQGGQTHIFVYDRNFRRTTRISVTEEGLPANASSFRPSISENGRFVAFESLATNLDPDFTADELGNSPASQVYVVDRDVSDIGVFDEPGNTKVRLASFDDQGNPANEDVSFAELSLSGDAIAFQSSASLNGTYSDDPEQIWYRTIDTTTGDFTLPTTMASVDQSGDPGKGDSSEPAVNGGLAGDYGLQIAFVSEADNLVPDDTNGVPDIFVRDFSDPSKPVTTRVSVSNPRVAFGRIYFNDPELLPGVAPNRPASQPDPGDTVKLDDGINPAVTLTFVETASAQTDVEIAETTGATRVNLANTINDLADFGNLNFFADPSNPPTARFNNRGANGFGPGVTVFNTVPGAQGNTAILVDSPNDKVDAEGMRGGGTEAVDLNANEIGGEFVTAPRGNLQPSIDRSGRLVSFRSLARNLDVVRDGDRFIRASGEDGSPGVGEIIRPLFRAPTSNVYLRDRDLEASGALDQPDNTDTERVSVNRFGYPTNRLANSASTGSSRQPALSADGRFVAFASDSTNIGGLRFGRTNTQILDFNDRRDVFIFDRNTIVPPSDEPENPPVVNITNPSVGDRLSVASPFFVNASAIGFEESSGTFSSRAIESVTFFANGQEVAVDSEPPFTASVTPSEVGPIKLFAVARDSRGVAESSEVVSIETEVVTEDFPDILITRPTSQEVDITVGETVSLEAELVRTAVDPTFDENFNFARFSFFVDGTQVFTTTDEQEVFEFDFEVDRSGEFDLVAGVVWQRTDSDLFINEFSERIRFQSQPFEPLADDRDFASEIIRRLTGEAPSSSQLDNAESVLDGTIDSRAQFIADLLNSPRIESTRIALMIFRTMVGEWPGPADLDESLEVLLNEGGGVEDANALTTSLIPRFENRFGALNNDLGFVRQIFRNKHFGVGPNAQSENRLLNSLTGGSITLSNGQVVPGYGGDLTTYTTQFALDNESSQFEGPNGLDLSSVHLYSLPNFPAEQARLVAAISALLGIQPTPSVIEEFSGSSLEAGIADILTDPRFLNQFSSDSVEEFVAARMLSRGVNDPALRTPGADADGDGQSNLMEIVLGSDPTDSSDTPGALSTSMDNGDFVVEFTRIRSNELPGDVDIVVECSEDMNVWEPADPEASSISDAGDQSGLPGPDFVRKEFRIPTTAQDCNYVRITVNTP